MERARELGTLLAEKGIGLIFGGGRVGLMGAVADAVLANGGEAVGVIPKGLVAREVAHQGVTDLRVVGSMHERKALMEDLADAFISLPGGYGTLEETFEIITWAQLGIHAKPVGLLNVDGFYDPLLAFIERTIQEDFLLPEYARLVVVRDQPTELLDVLVKYRPTPSGPRWLDEDET